jgi:hypothetical protein
MITPKNPQTTSNPDHEAGGCCGPLPCSADFIMPFGKYRGRTLDDISEDDLGYVVWLADENVLTIETQFLDAVRCDYMEQQDGSEFWNG